MSTITRVVTISASFGSGGSVIGPAVAERLEVPFVDRAIPDAVAAEIGCTLEEALAHDDRAEHGLGRVLAGAARLPSISFGGMDVYLARHPPSPEEDFVEHTERIINEVVAEKGGVVLGRAGALVLSDHPTALHVRLHGPRARRITNAVAMLSVSEREARRMLHENDRARTAYVKNFYRADPADPALYHLVIDSTELSADLCADLIVRAAQARADGQG